MLQSRVSNLRDDFDKVLGKIRRYPGLEHFLALPGWEDIDRAVIPQLPLVYLLAEEEGGLALIVSRDGPGLAPRITSIWLKGFTLAKVHAMLSLSGDASILDGLEGQPTSRRTRPFSWQESILYMTRQLWKLAMQPVIEHLQVLGAQQAVLLPVGLTLLLPLHAAGDSVNGWARTAFDVIELIYAPSAQLIVHARQTTEQFADDSALIVGVPLANSKRPLENARRETLMIASMFESSTTLIEAQATTYAVQQALQKHSVAHFACHGRIDVQNLDRSGLVLSGGTSLTIDDLLAMPQVTGKLAVLSACGTGIAGLVVPDEVFSLSATLIRLGFGSVVGSLWSVEDRSTALLMERFYRLWKVEGEPPAKALITAQQWLRDSTNRDFAEYYEQFLPVSELPLPACPLPTTIAREYVQVFSNAGDLNDRPYALPYFWAAFQFVGC